MNNNKEIKQHAAIAIYPVCVEIVNKYPIGFCDLGESEKIEQQRMEHAADMAVKYAEALMKRLNE